MARYIFGANHGGDKFAITAPVGQTRCGSMWIVRLTMPTSYNLATLAAPNDLRVRLSLQPPTHMGALGFSGWAAESVVKINTGALLERTNADRLHILGSVTLA